MLKRHSMLVVHYTCAGVGWLFVPGGEVTRLRRATTSHRRPLSLAMGAHAYPVQISLACRQQGTCELIGITPSEATH